MDYKTELKRIPPPGGNGCHTRLLGVANLGVKEGHTPEQVAADLRAGIPIGTRRVSDREILDAVEKAAREAGQCQTDKTTWTPCATTTRPRVDAAKLRMKIMALGSPDEADLWESSPVRLDGMPEDDAVLLLRHFYQPDEFLFLGDTYDKHFLRVDDWLSWFETEGTAGLPFIVPNPMDGEEHENLAGKKSRRCDASVKAFRFCVIEFDDIPREDQLRFWSGVINRNLLPVACLIDSGNKSIHAWLRVDIPDREAWDREIKQRLFEQWLVPIGVDPATKNPARLSRLPGHKRAKTGRWQRLLWLQQKGN